MIAAKYRLFSAEPKLVSSRDTRTEEAAVLGISIWSPRDKSRMVGYRKLSGFDGGISPAKSASLLNRPLHVGAPLSDQTEHSKPIVGLPTQIAND